MEHNNWWHVAFAFNTIALLSIHTHWASFHFGVYKDEFDVYKPGVEEQVSCDWIWGRATESYDSCMEYFGLGPFFLVCW